MGFIPGFTNDSERGNNIICHVTRSTAKTCLEDVHHHEKL